LRRTTVCLPGAAMTPRFPLFTSIGPPIDAAELAYLCDCLNSWRSSGFGPVAVNGPAENEALRQLDLPIEFAPLPADGKPRIGDLLSAVRERSAASLCGSTGDQTSRSSQIVQLRNFSGIEIIKKGGANNGTSHSTISQHCRLR
jgi:hypothetical protein